MSNAEPSFRQGVLYKESYPCPYITDGRTASVAFLFPDDEYMCGFNLFLEKGYRRAGDIFYCNICEACSACKPIRLDPACFVMSKGQKRTMNANRDIRVVVNEVSPLSDEKVALYDKYVGSKHADPLKKPGDPRAALESICFGYPGTIEMEYYLDDGLIGVGIVDGALDALSSNYFYYDTDFLSRRPGVFSVINEILLCRQLGRKYYYLGFYVEETSKMRYKKDFRPNQIYEGGEWKDFLQGKAG